MDKQKSLFHPEASLEQSFFPYETDKVEEQAQRIIVIRQMLGEKQDLETQSMDILSSWLGLGTLTLMIILKLTN